MGGEFRFDIVKVLEYFLPIIQKWLDEMEDPENPKTSPKPKEFDAENVAMTNWIVYCALAVAGIISLFGVFMFILDLVKKYRRMCRKTPAGDVESGSCEAEPGGHAESHDCAK